MGTAEDEKKAGEALKTEGENNTQNTPETAGEKTAPSTPETAGDKEKTKKKGNGFGSFFLILLILTMAAGGLWYVSWNRGKTQLYESDTSVPTLPIEEEETEEEEMFEQVDDVDRIIYKGKRYTYNEETLNFLVMGALNWEKMQPAKDFASSSRVTTLSLVSLNPKTYQASMIVINRDSMAPVDTYDAEGNYLGTVTKQVGRAHCYGDDMEISAEFVVQSTSRLFHNIPIHGYVCINMGFLPDINDAAGHITVRDMEAVNGEIVYGDEIEIVGEQVYDFLMDHSGEFAEDNLRVKKQREYMTNLLRKLMAEMRANPLRSIDYYKLIRPYMVTNVTGDEANYLATQARKYINRRKIYGLTGEVRNSATRDEEFWIDEENLLDTMVEIFYTPLED